MQKILVTGGASFIGSEFTRQLIGQGIKPVVIDKITYAGDLERLKEVKGKFVLYKKDICAKKDIRAILQKEMPDVVVHFAAESHVDRSILGSDEFITTNVQGTQILLDAARAVKIKKFIYISTDEVYGDIEKGQFFETTPLNPSSPYSASKAAADLLVKAYQRTFGFPAITVRPSNNYGPWQYPEKLIPVIIYKAMTDQKIPVYAEGLNVREWLYVSDCASAIAEIMERGKVGEVYNLGSGYEKKNIEVVHTILNILNKPNRLIEFVKDRPGHDLRYSLNSSKLRKELGWSPKVTFEEGIQKTVDWYRGHKGWVESKIAFLKEHWERTYKK